MRVGIMQPYFLPYIGYFQLMACCDVFVIYDDIEYTKRGWINRNRLLFNESSRTFTIPIQRDSDYKDVRERRVSESFDPHKLLSLFRQAYSKAPFWEENVDLIYSIIEFPSRNLFEYVFHSIRQVVAKLMITTDLVKSSDLRIEKSLRGEKRVLKICEMLGAKQYVNPIGGIDLYSDLAFKQNGIDLMFFQSHFPHYEQFSHPFVEALSIIDVLMFVDIVELRKSLSSKIEIIVR